MRNQSSSMRCPAECPFLVFTKQYECHNPAVLDRVAGVSAMDVMFEAIWPGRFHADAVVLNETDDLPFRHKACREYE